MTSPPRSPPAPPGWLDALLDQSVLGAYEVSPDLRLTHASLRCGQILGRSGEALLALPSFLDVVAPADRDRVRRSLQARLAGSPEPRQRVFRACRADGTEVPVEVQECTFRRQGTPFVAGVMLDVTDRSTLEAQLRRSQRMEAVGELTGAVAHDFNNLLTAMLTPVELAITELGEEHPLSSSLVQVRSTVLRAAGLTRQLLHYSRDRVHRAQVLRIADLLRDMRPLLEGIAGEGIRLDLHVEGRAPHVYVDPTHMEQVLVNLLVNARDAMGGVGRVGVRVEGARLAGGDDGAAIIVEDSGPGVPLELRERIFDPFFTTKEEGTGLGLSTVAGIVRESGGEIRVEGRPDGGARFVVLLPATRGKAARPGARPAGGLPPEVPGRVRILLLDDEPEVRRVVAAALKRFGHDVLTAADPEEALAAARTEGHRLDLIVSDVRLPNHSGFEAVRTLLPFCPRARVVFTTGAGAEVDVDGDGDAEALQAVWLEKPFSLDELMDAVRRGLAVGPTGRRRTGEGW